ncbi:MAG: zinc-binding dehydrogenase [Streptosporangiaceae bacterium]
MCRACPVWPGGERAPIGPGAAGPAAHVPGTAGRAARESLPHARLRPARRPEPAGRLRPVVGQEFGLARAAAAHAAIEARATVGKTLLVVPR